MNDTKAMVSGGLHSVYECCLVVLRRFAHFISVDRANPKV